MSHSPVDAGALRPGERNHELAAIVALIRARIVPPHHLAALIDQFGSAVRVVQLSETDRLFVPRQRSDLVIGAVTSEDLGKALQDVLTWRGRAYDVRSFLEAAYPESLQDIFDRPPLLFFEGSWRDEVDARSVAVVGARHATEKGIERARLVVRALVQARYTVLSGLAVGIDAAAHMEALDAGGRTVAVMGTGIEYRYPPPNVPLSERIIKSGGALLSQFFPHQRPTRWTFPLRNVVMSGLALATVVVEASSTSGARMQARIGLQHGRTVFLPGSLVRTHEWAKKYVTEGAYGTRAIEVTSPEEIIERLEGKGASEVALAV